MMIGCSADDTPSFIGVIEEINGEQALVHIEEGEILASGNLVMVDLSKASGTSFAKGDRIEVQYGGEVRESYPLGIDTISVKLVEEK